jgi:hypothetical protein
MRNGLLAQVWLGAALDAEAGQLICIRRDILRLGPQRQQGEKKRKAGAGGNRDWVEFDAPGPTSNFEINHWTLCSGVGAVIIPNSRWWGRIGLSGLRCLLVDIWRWRRGSRVKLRSLGRREAFGFVGRYLSVDGRTGRRRDRVDRRWI